ncbi:MAG: homocysteine S-methyltransferase family protein [Phycisphaerae bacterium]
MAELLQRLEERKLLVSDGAWGTMLQAAGLESGQAPERWNLEQPEKVRAVAAAYAEAGSDLVLTNTFGGSRLKLAKLGVAEQTAELNRAGAANSIAAAGEALVAGSVGPTGEFLEPYGEMTEPELEAVFAEQIDAMVAAGVSAVCIETMSAIEEAICAIRAARSVGGDGLDVICTMTFDPGQRGYRTMMGTSCAEAAERLTQAGADVVGSNCGNGIEQMVEIAAQMRAVTDRPILIHANAGLPQRIDGRTVFTQTPADFAARVEALVAAGASIIGGCCGTTPEHIAAIAAEVARLRS